MKVESDLLFSVNLTSFSACCRKTPAFSIPKLPLSHTALQLQLQFRVSACIDFRFSMP